MKKTDFEAYKLHLAATTDIDTSLRHITEDIKLLSQMRSISHLEHVARLLFEARVNISNYIMDNVLSNE